MDSSSSSRSQSTAGAQEGMMYQRLLCQYSRRKNMHLPFYTSNNEGLKDEPMYRSTVWIDGTSYTSSNAYPQRDEAHMDVSRVAYLAITQKMKDESFHHVLEGSILCKEILPKYADKMNLAKPIYQTTKIQNTFYQSSCVFNGVTYTGEVSRKRKEAEQLAARVTVLSLLDSESGNVIAELVNCKILLAARANKQPCSSETGTMPAISTQKYGEVEEMNDKIAPTETLSSSEGYGLLYAYPQCGRDQDRNDESEN